MSRTYKLRLLLFSARQLVLQTDETDDRANPADRRHKKMMNRDQYTELEQLPNIGPAMAGDLRLIGILYPYDLVKQDPYAMYDKLCRKTQHRHDPCVLDAFISAVRFMQGAPKRPWWAYTAERKKMLAKS